MFGHQDGQSNQQQDTNQIPQQSIDDAAADSENSQQIPSVPPPIASPVTGQATDQSGDDNWQHPGTPLESESPTTISPATSTSGNADLPVPDSDDDTVNLQDNQQSSGDNPPPSADELIDIKQQALTQLSPLVGHLDQTPEEKFRTTMMMIQASDDQSMIKTAFQAAQAISDEKVRAQALLDVVNEINYFTQNQPNGQ